MTIQQASEDIYERMRDGWTLTQYAVDNKKAKPAGIVEYVHLWVEPATSVQRTMGPALGRKFLRPGIIAVQVFTPSDTNVSRNNEIAQAVRDLFEGVRFGIVVATTSTHLRVGLDGGGFYQSNVNTDFEWMETK